jgi:uncharacterized protein
MSRLVRANAMELEKMQFCPDFALCNGWCPHERYLSARHNPNHSASCCGLRDVIDHVRQNVPSSLLSPVL